MQGHGFDPWSGKNPHAAGQGSLCTTTAEACSPTACYKRTHHSEKPVRRVATVLCSWRKPVLSNEDPAQPPKINKYSEKWTKDVGSDTISDSELSCRTTNWSLRIDWWEPLHTLELEVPCHSSTAMPLWLQKKTGQIYVYALLFLWRVASGLSQEGSGKWDKSSQSVIHRCVA